MKKWIYNLSIFIILAFILLPIISMVIWSFFSTWNSRELLSTRFTFDGFSYFFSSKDWIIGVKSTLFSILVGIISLILSIMAARFFISFEVKHKIFLESVFYIPMLIPVISVCLGSHKFIGRYFTSSGVALLFLHIYFSLPYAFKMMYSYYSVWGIEEELIARGLGASRWKAFKYINVPLYMQGYVSTFIMAFIISFSQYFINLFIGDSNHLNFSMIMTPYISSSNRNLAAVYTLMFVLYSLAVMVITTLISRRCKNSREVYEDE